MGRSSQRPTRSKGLRNRKREKEGVPGRASQAGPRRAHGAGPPPCVPCAAQDSPLGQTEGHTAVATGVLSNISPITKEPHFRLASLKEKNSETLLLSEKGKNNNRPQTSTMSGFHRRQNF